MQASQKACSKKAVKLYETYENKLTDALATYWSDSITVGVSLQTSLADLTSQYVASLNAASDGFSDTTLTAGKSFDETSLNAAETRVGADDTADTSRINNVMNTWIAAANTAYTSVTGAVGTLLTSNLTASRNWFDSEMSGVGTMITDLLATAVAGITAGMDRGTGLVDGVLGAVGGYVNGLNTSAAEIDVDALQKSAELSQSEIEARVAYYKAVSKADREDKEAKIETNTKRKLQEINYVYKMAMNQLNKALADILVNSNYHYAGRIYNVFFELNTTNFYKNVQITFGSHWYESGYFSEHYTYGSYDY